MHMLYRILHSVALRNAALPAMLSDGVLAAVGECSTIFTS